VKRSIVDKELPQPEQARLRLKALREQKGAGTIRDETTKGPPVEVLVFSYDSDNAAKATMTDLGCYKSQRATNVRHRV
jgi:hypothetical protein